MVGTLIGFGIIAVAVLCARALRRVDEAPHEEQRTDAQTPVLVYTPPRSFSEPAPKGFSRGVARFPRGHDAA
jgi:hypothetical protein